jgi:hypothetical protein
MMKIAGRLSNRLGVVKECRPLYFVGSSHEDLKELTKILLQVIEDHISILNTSFITLSLDTVEIKRLK